MVFDNELRRVAVGDLDAVGRDGIDVLGEGGLAGQKADD